MEELKVFLYRSMFKRIFLFLFPLNANLFFVLIVSNRFVEITQVKEKERERETNRVKRNRKTNQKKEEKLLQLYFLYTLVEATPPRIISSSFCYFLNGNTINFTGSIFELTSHWLSLSLSLNILFLSLADSLFLQLIK